MNNKIIEDNKSELIWLKKLFLDYKENISNIIDENRGCVSKCIITKGEIINFAPYDCEMSYSNANGKIISEAIESKDCFKYYYDSYERLVLVEKFDESTADFSIRDIYIYADKVIKLYFSSNKVLATVSCCEGAFDNSKSKILYSGYADRYIIQNYFYNSNLLDYIETYYIDKRELSYKNVVSIIKFSSDWLDSECLVSMQCFKFYHEKGKLTQIIRNCENGDKELFYTTKKPKFDQISANIKSELQKYIEKVRECSSIGFECFLDQQSPNFYVCFTSNSKPGDLIADWSTEMFEIPVYDYMFTDAQERKCLVCISEIIIELVQEQILNNKKIYFHQNQLCVTEMYPKIKRMFNESNVIVY